MTDFKPGPGNIQNEPGAFIVIESKEVLKIHTVTEESWKDTTCAKEPLPHQACNSSKKKKIPQTLTQKDIYIYIYTHMFIVSLLTKAKVWK